MSKLLTISLGKSKGKCQNYWQYHWVNQRENVQITDNITGQNKGKMSKLLTISLDKSKGKCLNYWQYHSANQRENVQVTNKQINNKNLSASAIYSQRWWLQYGCISWHYFYWKIYYNIKIKLTRNNNLLVIHWYQYIAFIYIQYPSSHKMLKIIGQDKKIYL